MFKSVLLAVAFSVSSFALAQACSVDLGRGWSRGGGSGTLVMGAGEKACGGTLWVVPDARIAKAIAVTAAPANGKLTARGGSFAYTPNKGFKGADRFNLSAQGPDKSGAMTTLTGSVSVTVQ